MTPIKERYNLQKLTFDSSVAGSNLSNPAINLFSKKEKDDEGEFFWLQEEGDLLTITNQDSKIVNGSLFFNFRLNPCGFNQKIVVGDKSKKIIVELSKNNPEYEVKIDFNLDPFTSSYHFINSFEGESCIPKNGDNRKLISQIRNLKFEIR